MPLVALARLIAADPPQARRRGAAFGWGLLAGVVFFAPLVSWVGRFGTLPWVLLSVVQGAFVGLYMWGLSGWGERRGRTVWAVVWWIALEALRSQLPLGGFPWGVLGATQHDGGMLLGAARTGGVLAVSAACAAVAVATEAALRCVAARRARGLWRPAAAVAAVGVLAAAMGVPRPAPTGAVLDVAAVQGNDLELAPIADRGDEGRVVAVVDRMVDATRRLAGAPAPDLVVWPENALDADPREVEVLGAAVREAITLAGGAPLLAGALLDGPRDGTFLNTMALFDPELVDIYTKRRLVPFGEYVPWRSVLGDFGPLRQIPSDGVPGDGPRVLSVAGALVGPITCYESVFSELVGDQVRAGAQLLVVSTNNASFGRTPASRQHLAFSQVRAVETGRWVLHAGISGLSGVVSPDAEVTQRTELFEQAVVRARLPLVEGLTPATRAGAWPERAVLVVAAAGLLSLGLNRRRARAASAQAATAQVPTGAAQDA